MDDLRRRFATLDDEPMPDLWTDIERRAANGAVAGRTSRVPAVRPTWIDANSRSLALLLAVAGLIVALIAGAILAGSGPPRLPAVVPLPSTTSDVSPAPDASPAPAGMESTGQVVYAVEEQIRTDAECDERPWRCVRSRYWIANADGSDPRLLLPDVPLGFFGWSPDGTRILYEDESGAIWSIAPDGTGAERIGTYDTLCEPRCTMLEEFAYSPDGSRLAYAAGRSPETGDTSIIAIFELETGRITELASTATRMDGPFCDTSADEGTNDPPRWSPDGNRLAFARQVIGPRDADGYCQSTIYVVDADGTDLRQIVPATLHPLNPQWSPDGQWIAFHTADMIPTPDSLDDVGTLTDIYLVRPDGSDLRRLTADGGSYGARWTRDGRLVYLRRPAPEPTEPEPRIMDADGGRASRLEVGSLAELSAVGCIVCPYPSGPGNRDAYWQPTP